jgi:hypothetical protein
MSPYVLPLAMPIVGYIANSVYGASIPSSGFSMYRRLPAIRLSK